MLKKLLHTSISMAELTNFEVSVKDGIVSAIYSTHVPGEKVVELSSEESRTWLSAFEELNVANWEARYVNEDIVFGEQWTVFYEAVNETSKHIHGSNKYPANWDSFLYLIDQLANMPDSRRIDKMSITLSVDPYQRDKTIEAEQRRVIENLIISRAEGKFVYNKNVGQTFSMSKELNSSIGVSALLDRISKYINLDVRSENEPDLGYVLKTELEFYQDNPLTIYGTYNRNFQVDHWSRMIGEIVTFIGFHERTDKFFGEISKPNFVAFRHKKPRLSKPGKYIYCGVSLGNSNIYHYRTVDETIKFGDKVVVPVGSEGKEKIGVVVEVRKYDRDRVPYPLEKTKFIIRKDAE